MLLQDIKWTDSLLLVTLTLNLFLIFVKERRGPLELVRLWVFEESICRALFFPLVMLSCCDTKRVDEGLLLNSLEYLQSLADRLHRMLVSWAQRRESMLHRIYLLCLILLLHHTLEESYTIFTIGL